MGLRLECPPRHQFSPIAGRVPSTPSSCHASEVRILSAAPVFTNHRQSSVHPHVMRWANWLSLGSNPLRGPSFLKQRSRPPEGAADYLSGGEFRALQWWRGTKGDRGPIPGIDRDHRAGEIDELLFRKMVARLLIHLVRHVMVADLCHRFGPGEGRTLARTVDRRLAPSVEQVHPLIAFAVLAGIVGVHDDTISAPVDLRGADFNQINQLSLQAAGLDILL